MALNLSRAALRYLKGRHYGTLAPLARTEDMKVSTLGNSIKVTALDNISPNTSIGQVSFFVKAGSRYETPYQLGVTHYLRATALNNTGPFSGFKLIKSIDEAGGNLSIQTTREHTIYTIEGPSSEMEGFTNYLGAILTKPTFEVWYREECEWRILEDLVKYRANNDIVAFEDLHRAAYRYNLGNSVYCPDSMIGYVDGDMLKYFIIDHFRGEDITVVGTGVQQGQLEKFVEPLEPLDQVYKEVVDLLENPQGRVSFDHGSSIVLPVPKRDDVEIVDMDDIFKIPQLPAKYYGGELRTRSKTPDATFILAKEGVSYQNEKEVLASGILQMILGTGIQMKYGSGGGSNKLTTAVAQASDSRCSGSAININYSDSGLFGFAVTGAGYEMRAAVETANKVFTDTLSNVAAKDVEDAKKKLKSAYAFYAEKDANLIYEIGTKGKAFDLNAVFNSIDKLSQQDVAKLADKLKSSPSTASAAGNIMNTPVLQEFE
ncbi:cytochrome b-c1 complex subunit 2, mitochondrial-like [Crassostrea virginica]|uniref:Cytochrome b-c1 complex subunit 2, mitochondrial-like n=1 Tax=Crassostrea virginica TaxID=6565 RepID=A0A8B8CRY2_CRAVI|nr:cytochrome b-c1 complex subunit 2, mitochondrial-like [Crassostrea virginica]